MQKGVNCAIVETVHLIGLNIKIYHIFIRHRIYLSLVH